MFNQLVRSRAQLCSWQSSFLFQVNEPKTPVIEISYVKWKKGGLFAGARIFSRSRREINLLEKACPQRGTLLFLGGDGGCFI